MSIKADNMVRTHTVQAALVTIFFAQIVGEMHGVLHYIVKRLGRQ
jgi:hypothetical protein